MRRRVREDQALVVKRIFTDTAAGIGLFRIAKALNRQLPAPTPKGTKLSSGGYATGEWSPTAVSEILSQRRFLGIETYGRTKRVKRRGSTKGRVASPDRTIETHVPSLTIIDKELWDRAHAAKGERRAALLRNGRGRLQGQRESLVGKYLLSGHLACGASRPDGTVCGEPLTVVRRGRNLTLGYACRSRIARGPSACTNGTTVPMAPLHGSVVMALKSEFTPEKFEAHLRKIAGDDEAKAQRAATRGRLIARMPEITREEANITHAIAAGGDLDPLVARLKALKAEREAAEADLAALEADERDIQEITTAVERLQSQWGDWTAALDAAVRDGGVVPDAILQVARQVLRKVLHLAIYVVPKAAGEWDFHGAADVDGYVRGSFTRDGTVVVEEPLRGGGLRYRAREISGGSDGGGSERGIDMAPYTPRSASAEPWRSSTSLTSLSA